MGLGRVLCDLHLFSYSETSQRKVRNSVHVGPLAGDRTTRHPLNSLPSQLPPSPTAHEYLSFPLLLCPADEILRVELVHTLDDGLHELSRGGVVGVLGNGDDSDPLLAQHGLECHGVFTLSGKAAEFPD